MLRLCLGPPINCSQSKQGTQRTEEPCQQLVDALPELFGARQQLQFRRFVFRNRLEPLTQKSNSAINNRLAGSMLAGNQSAYHNNRV